MEPITLHIEYTLAEYREASRVLYKRQRRAFRPIQLLYFAALFAVICWVATGGSFNLTGLATSVSWRPFLISLMPYWILLAALFVTVRFWRSSYVNRIYRNRHAAQRPHEVTIDDNGIVLSEPLSRHEYLWQAFLRWQETRNLLLIFTTEANAHLIPKRVFADESQLERMRDILRTRIDLSNSAQQAFPVRALPVKSPLPLPPLETESPTPR